MTTILCRVRISASSELHTIIFVIVELEIILHKRNSKYVSNNFDFINYL